MHAHLCVLKYIAASLLHILILGYAELITSRNVIYLELLMNTRKHTEEFASMHPKSDCIHQCQPKSQQPENWLMSVKENVIEKRDRRPESPLCPSTSILGLSANSLTVSPLPQNTLIYKLNLNL